MGKNKCPAPGVSAGHRGVRGGILFRRNKRKKLAQLHRALVKRPLPILSPIQLRAFNPLLARLALHDQAVRGRFVNDDVGVGLANGIVERMYHVHEYRLIRVILAASERQLAPFDLYALNDFNVPAIRILAHLLRVGPDMRLAHGDIIALLREPLRRLPDVLLAFTKIIDKTGVELFIVRGGVHFELDSFREMTYSLK